MLDLDSDDLNASIETFMNNYTALDLLNYGLQNQSLMEEFLTQNDIKMLSPRLPGIIIQVYLLVAKKFSLNVFGPLIGEVGGTIVDNVSVHQDCNADAHENSIQDVVLEEVPVKTEQTGTVANLRNYFNRIRISKFYILNNER